MSHLFAPPPQSLTSAPCAKNEEKADEEKLIETEGNGCGKSDSLAQPGPVAMDKPNPVVREFYFCVSILSDEQGTSGQRTLFIGDWRAKILMMRGIIDFPATFKPSTQKNDSR